MFRYAGPRRKWVALKARRSNGEALAVNLVIDGRRTTVRVATLVLRAWVGPRPLGHSPLHFPDPDPRNCRADNLRWAPRGSSVAGRKFGAALDPPAFLGEDNPGAGLTEPEVIEIRALYRDGWSIEEIASDRRRPYSTVRNILAGITWSHVPDPLGPIEIRRSGSPSGGWNHQARLDWERVRRIRSDHAAGKSMRSLARENGVTPRTIRLIVLGEIWKEES